MVAEVSTLIRLMNGSSVRSNESSSSKSTALITRDLLGGCCSSTIDSKELDLDSQVPSGWEKRLDLKSGKVYLERSNYSTLVHNKQHTSCNNQLSLFEDTKLELKLLPSSPISSSGNYHSVCTLEKVKSALERAEKELSTRNKRKSSISSSSSIMSMSMTSSSSSNYSNSSIDDMSSSNSFAAGCPSCLIYVLLSKTNPRCPRCNSTIVPILPHHVGMKKPRIDLNISI